MSVEDKRELVRWLLLGVIVLAIIGAMVCREARASWDPDQVWGFENANLDCVGWDNPYYCCEGAQLGHCCSAYGGYMSTDATGPWTLGSDVAIESSDRSQCEFHHLCNRAWCHYVIIVPLDLYTGEPAVPCEHGNQPNGPRQL